MPQVPVEPDIHDETAGVKSISIKRSPPCLDDQHQSYVDANANEKQKLQQHNLHSSQSRNYNTTNDVTANDVNHISPSKETSAVVSDRNTTTTEPSLDNILRKNHGTQSPTLRSSDPETGAKVNNNHNKTNGAVVNNFKLNGLKNRIIQRPPPLILDKVSNFSIPNENDAHRVPSLPSPQLVRNSAQLENNQQDRSSIDRFNPLRIEQVNTSSIQAANNSYNTQTSVAAKQKFWKSLSESRNASALARQSRMPNLSNNNLSSSSKVGLGADLIVTHRNTNDGSVHNVSKFQSTRSHNNISSVEDSSNFRLESHESQNDSCKRDPMKVYETKCSEIDDESDNMNKAIEPSNGSERDDMSTHGGNSDSGGGNLIGVDNPTPPASTTVLSDHESGGLIRSRSSSTNPFLTVDDDGSLSDVEVQNNFHRRPASFMAATIKKPNVNSEKDKNNSEIPLEQFSRMHMTETSRDQHPHDSDLISQNNQWTDSITVKSQNLSKDHSDSPQDLKNSSRIPWMPAIGANYFNGELPHASKSHSMQPEAIINKDSENAKLNPPPSATLPLPHWTETMYELNNAILDPGTVGGGSENGQLIYIINSGDIILELDQIKVSGFTLVEFNELVESKPTHLLTAVQTKHSHSLTVDIKRYLSYNFLKDSADKKLQDLIRENVYRRTIPCTTRPPKECEVDKIDYHFLTREQFDELDKLGLLLESGMFSGHCYGTMRPSTDISNLLNRKRSQEDSTTSVVNQNSDEGFHDNGSNRADLSYECNNSLYANRESLRSRPINQTDSSCKLEVASKFPNVIKPPVAVIDASETERLPPGWEKAVDPTYGTFYVDHNSQRTQYERPFEIELTKSDMGFGFTLVEHENGLLIVRGIIPGGPAQQQGSIIPGDILMSVVGIPVSTLQHTDIARLFSAFVPGDKVKLTFARGNYVVDSNFMPDEYVISNGSNDKLMMMHLQQQQQQDYGLGSISQNYMPGLPAPSDYQPIPVYSNSDMLKVEPALPVPPKPILPFYANNEEIAMQRLHYVPENHITNNYYANNEEIAMQRLQYSNPDLSSQSLINSTSNYHDFNSSIVMQGYQNINDTDEYECHQIDLDRDSTESNWGIRLIGGAEVNRAISIGSVVFGSAASKSGRLKSGDEIISINGLNVVGATHHHVVELISGCANRASLVIRRKKFAEACDVILTRNMDEGFGFVIISSGNCALIGRIIEGSPADRCQQLHVRDRIIAVNGRTITANMHHPEIVNMIKESESTLRLRIIPADCYTVDLIKSSSSDNFGFRMRGGSEYDGMPLYILKVAANGLARDLLNVGDQIIEINGIPTVGMTHLQAASIIKHSDPIVKLKLRRNHVTPPSLLVDSPRALQKFNQVTAEMKPVHSGSYQGVNESSSTSSEFGSMNQQTYSSSVINEGPRVIPSDSKQSRSMPLFAA